MARIRTIKPEFWSDEKLAPLPVIDRLVFLGLISMADDAGRLVDNLKMIDAFIFPYSDDSARDSLETLAKLSRITRYKAANGQRLIQINGWATHQRVDRPSGRVLPGPEAEHVVSCEDRGHSRETREHASGDSRDTRDGFASDSPLDLGSRIRDLGSGIRDQGSRTEDGDEGAAATAAPLIEPLGLGEYEPDAEALLRAARNPVAVRATLAALMNGLHGSYAPAEIGLAIRDFVANGEAFNAAKFRRYCERARSTLRGDDSSPAPSRRNNGHAPAIGAGGKTYLNALRALEEP